MMWRLLLITCIFISESLCCIPCNERGREAMDAFTTLIQGDMPEYEWAEDPILQIQKADERHFLDYLEKEVRILDTYAISAIVSEYQKSVDTIKATELEDELSIPTIRLHYQHLKEKVKVILQDLEDRKCPNKQGADSCGLMVQTFINCKTCDEEKVVCAGGPPENQEYFDRCPCLCTQGKCVDLKTGHSCSPCPDLTSRLAETLNCGEENIRVTEDDDLILDCGLQWYARLEESYKHQFMEKTDPEPVVANNPYLKIRGVKMEDATRYTCTTILDSGIPVSKITYSVSVVGTMENDQPRLMTLDDTRVPEPPLDPALEDNDGNIIAICAAASFFVICCICGFIFYRIVGKLKKPVKEEPV